MYIDPNTGGVLFQVLAVVLAMFSGAVLLFSSKIKAGMARFQRSRRKDEPEGHQEPTEPESSPVTQTQDDESYH